MPTRICIHPGCDRTCVAVGYCRVHRDQFKKHGTTWDIGSTGAASHRCRAPGCTKPTGGKWYCPDHRRLVGVCSSQDCSELRRSMANSFCDEHARRNRTVKHFYGITLLEYEAITRAQGGCCAICERETKLHLDHDHTTGTVRGMLCGSCNRGIGLLAHDPVTLRRAADYVERG